MIEKTEIRTTENDVDNEIRTTKNDVDYAREVWDTLSDIDVSEHSSQLPEIKDKQSGRIKRPAVDYLPWHKAWMLVKREYPASTYKHSEDLIHEDTTVEVEVFISIKKTLEGSYIFTTARLAVMDFHFSAIRNPDSRERNDSRQRCLVKALAFNGLGLNLWSDSSIPVGKLDEPISAKQVVTLEKLIEKSGTNMEFFLEWAGVDSLDLIPLEKYASARYMMENKK